MHKQRQAEGGLDEDGSVDAGDGASPDKEDAEAEAEAEDDETVFPPADGFAPEEKGKTSTVTVTSKGMGLGGVGRGFASLFSSSGSSSSKNNRVHGGSREEDEDSGSPRRGDGTGTDDSEEDAEEGGEGTDDDDSLLRTDRASSKGHVSIGFSRGIHASPLPIRSGERLPPPSEFEDDEEDEMGELVGPGKDEGNSSDEDVVGGAGTGEETNLSNEESHPVVHGVMPLRMGGTSTKDDELLPRPLGSPVKGKNAEPEKRAAEDSPDDDDDEGLVEIMMGHGRTGSGDGKIALGINRLGSSHGRRGSGDAGGGKGNQKGKGKENERKRASLG
jgi:hypothetical protein